ncbi:MAG: HAD hydrolase family protein [Ardenticatenaceae bacterium]|nr:HAD hydrolase family protein [Anaerolineales bacterium]MCB8940433.1 HAD hydrolase family protein [Ardenticatenaceae bacterium]MCB8973449.1 HAD hydrolase family protein [Ardenticatenaceae bacterium]
MYRQVLAFDFDGTLAKNGRVPLELQQALAQLRQYNFALFLVTGRRYNSIDLGSLQDIFTGIVWENGAVLTLKAIDDLYLPFGYVDAHLVAELETAGVPLEHGTAIVATWAPYKEAVRHTLDESGADAAIVYNKGAVMILPSGTTKGTGLERLLELCGFSLRNLVSFGDGENDISLIQVAEIGIAVADAVPGLKKAADIVTSQPGPAGVLEALKTYWLNKQPIPLPSRQEHLISLGLDDRDKPVSLMGATLISHNLGIFGDSGSGKSWITGLLVEEMHLAGFQVLVIDSDGDFRGLRSLPGIVAFSGEEVAFPTPEQVTAILEESTISMVLDLCSYSVTERQAYIADLLLALRPLKEHKFRPHWIVLEEAQHFLPPAGNDISAALQPLLDSGGCAFVSYRPDRLTDSVLAALNLCLSTRLSEPEAVTAVAAIENMGNASLTESLIKSLADMPKGVIWLCNQGRVRLRSDPRRVPHIRHLYKYLDIPLPKQKRFYFRTEQGYLDLEAASLYEFKEALANVSIESLIYHQEQNDFAAWVKGSLDDEILANHLNKLARRKYLQGEALRQALLQHVTARYVEIQTLR